VAGYAPWTQLIRCNDFVTTPELLERLRQVGKI